MPHVFPLIEVVIDRTSVALHKFIHVQAQRADCSASCRPMSDRGIVSIENLQLPFGLIAPDVWGKDKEQPALVSIKTTLEEGFGTAAQKDALDESTLHYGNLAKRIRASCKQNHGVFDFLEATRTVVIDMGRRVDGMSRLNAFVVTLKLPKATMAGEEVQVIDSADFIRSASSGSHYAWRRKFVLRRVHVMSLIGVNRNEREVKQPLIATVELDHDRSFNLLEMGIEQHVVQVCELSLHHTDALRNSHPSVDDCDLFFRDVGVFGRLRRRWLRSSTGRKRNSLYASQIRNLQTAGNYLRRCPIGRTCARMKVQALCHGCHGWREEHAVYIAG